MPVLLLLASGGARGQTPEGDEGTIRPGDRIVLTFFTGAGSQIPELSGELIVDRSGRIYLPFSGRLTVEGLSAAGLRELLEEEMSRFFENPVVRISVELRVNVTGAVRQPGHYFMDPSSTIIDALAQAGGAVTELGRGSGAVADMEHIRLIRAGQVAELDLRPDAVTDEVAARRIQSGDWIHVPQASRSLLRENLQIVGSFLSVLTGLIVLVTR